MKYALFIFALIAIFSGKINGEEIEQEAPNVYIVTDSNFDEILQKFPYVFVKFYAPWCGHCKTLAPEFSKAAKELQEKGVNVAFGSIDATVQTQLAQKFGIRGYPTVKMFIDGVAVEYESGRKSDDIVAWVEKKVNKKSAQIQANEDLDKIIAEKKVLAVYFGEENSEFEIFQKIVKQFDDVEFAHTFSQEIKDHFNGQKIVLFKQFDEKRNDYLEEFDAEKVQQFIAIHSEPIILEFEQKAAQKIFGEQRLTLAVFVDDEKHVKEYAEFELASKELKDKIFLTKSVIDKGLGQRFAEHLHVTADMLPVAFILKIAGQDLNKYKLKGDITAENLINFHNDFIQGKLLKEGEEKEEL